MANPTWHFEKMARSGSITGQAVVDSLTGADLSVEEVFAREALQNSCDATMPNLPTRVVIREIPVTSEGKISIEFESKLASHVANSINMRSQNEHTQKHVIIEDYNTCGLGGSLQEANEDDHFMRLVYHNATGLSKKGLSGDTGGSFGRGKAAYPYASDINTVFYYSVFKGEGGESCSRLIGVSYSKEYFIDNQQLTGRAFWGVCDEQEKDFFIEPITGDIAHDYAERIGFTRRQDNDFGTSILILNCPVDLSALCKAIELWWWPRLTDELLHVEIYDINQSPYYLQYRSDVVLNKYVSMYEAQKINMHNANISLETIKINDMNYGKLVYSIIELNHNQDTDYEDDIRLNAIALIRGPRMVVTYHVPRSMSNKKHGCGIFIADNDSQIDSFFKRSEPPAHDQWSHKSERLTRKEQENLSQIKLKISKLFRNFVSAEENKSSDETNYHGRELERMIGAIFGGKKGNKTPPITSRGDAISVTGKKTRAVSVAPNFVQHVIEFSVSLRNNYIADKAEVEVLVNTQLTARGSNGSALKIAFSSVSVDGEVQNNYNSDNGIRLDLSKKPVKFVYTTKVVDSTFQTETSVLVKLA